MRFFVDFLLKCEVYGVYLCIVCLWVGFYYLLFGNVFYGWGVGF